ncbi:MAG: F0F1 ATP synthase subunit B [Acidimicrobiia bacterium]|nr:F0F1 ATP synthase subunit B [bacterium]MXX00723.1 F0F1 ATP synthase subunit B [Acidimicrobiia bacterium]MDE0675609.1 F0F1 ATP synthase subunit B [bacterium]MXX45707.1 F0F1 ATP synthase subunit B [Acidimicrobiia bacterium]MXY73886.1 F0F1 ATP synthase subunit B [Acidimicrobiia bacterium]
MSADVLILAAEEEKSGLFLILPDVSELIWGAVSFVVIVFLVWKFAMPALDRALGDRQKAVVSQLEEAEEAKGAAERLRDDYQRRLDEGAQRADQMMEAARSDAESLRQEIIDRAAAEAVQITERARAEAESERARVLEEARQEITSLSLDIAEKVVGSQIDASGHQRLVERYIRELERETAE